MILTALTHPPMTALEQVHVITVRSTRIRVAGWGKRRKYVEL
jgi:hypothetical protein